MKHWTDIEKSKEGILQILQVVKHFLEEGDVRFIDGIQRCGLTEYKIEQLICIVRERKDMSRRELLRLSEIALTYNKLWATDDNNCFRDAETMFRKIRSTLKGTKIIYKRFTPICRKSLPDRDFRPSVFVKSTLAYAECGRDLYGLESYPDSVSTLYAEMGDFFTHVVAVLVICHQELSKEAEISKDADRCLQLLNEQCEHIVCDMKDVIGMFSKDIASQEELLKKSKKSGSLKDFAQKGFHKYNIANVKRYACARAVEKGTESGLGDAEALYFFNNPAKGLKAKEIMMNFDTYADKGRGDMMDTTALVEFACWSGLPISKACRYFTSSYTGNYKVPKEKSVWARFDSFRKADSGTENDQSIVQRLAADFEERVRSRN